MVLVAVFTWAASSIGYKFAMGTEGNTEKNPVTCIAFRNTTVAIFLLIFLPFFSNMGEIYNLSSDQARSYWTWAFIAAMGDIMGHFFYFNALKHLDSSRIYPLINFQMLFTFPISIFILKEPIPQYLWLSALLIGIGVFLIMNPDNKDKGIEGFSEEEKAKHLKKGICFGILTGMFYAFFYLAMAMQNRVYYGVYESNFSRMVVSVAILWGFMLIRPKHLPRFDTPEDKHRAKSYLIAGLFAVFSAGIGDATYQIGVKENGASVSITIASAAPLLNQVFSIAFLKEKFRYLFLIGVIFIVIGNILVIL